MSYRDLLGRRKEKWIFLMVLLISKRVDGYCLLKNEIFLGVYGKLIIKTFLWFRFI